MKITIITLASVLLAAGNVFSQTTASSENASRITLRAFASVGQSTFNTNISSPSKFPSAEMRLGLGASLPLSDALDLSTRLTWGVKLKRESFNDGQHVTIRAPFLQLDHVASDRNHYFIEIPLLLNMQLPGKKVGVQTGLNYRFFAPNNDAVDFLTNRGDLGLTAGAYYNVSDKIRIGGSYTFGLTTAYRSAGTVDFQPVDMTVRNQFYQVAVEYVIRKK